MSARPDPAAPRKRLLDLFCRAGGAARGYHDAGFEVTGVDLEPMRGTYPYTFIQGDAIEYVLAHGHEDDAIHASPPSANDPRRPPTARPFTPRRGRRIPPCRLPHRR